METPNRESASEMTSEVGGGIGIGFQPGVASPDVWESATTTSALGSFDVGLGARGLWVRLSIETTPGGFYFCGDEKPANTVEFCLGRYLAARLLPSFQVGRVSAGPVVGYSLPNLELGGQVRVEVWSFPNSGWTATWVVDGVGVSPDVETYGLLLETQLVFAWRSKVRPGRPPTPTL